MAEVPRGEWGSEAEGVLCPGEAREQAARGGYLPPTTPSIPSLPVPVWRDGILDSLLLTAPKHPHLPPSLPPTHTHIHTREQYMSTHTRSCALKRAPQGAEQSRAEHLDLPLVTHSGIRGTDGKRDGERECALGQTERTVHPERKYA